MRSYMMHIMPSKFDIRKEKIVQATEALYQFLKKDFPDANEKDDFIALLEKVNWTADYSKGDEITDIWFEGETLENEDELFDIIAPFVEEGSYIEICGADCAQWRWFFDGVKCIQQDAEIRWVEREY